MGTGEAAECFIGLLGTSAIVSKTRWPGYQVGSNVQAQDGVPRGDVRVLYCGRSTR